MTTVSIHKENGDGPSIAATGAQTLFLKLLIYVVGFVGSVVVSRALGPEGRGLYYLPVVAATTVVAFGKLGIEHVNMYLLGTRKIAVERLSGQNGLVALFMGSLGVLVLLQGPWLFPYIFAQTPSILLLLAALTVPFSMHQQFSAALLNLQGKVTWQFRASLSSGVIQLAALILLALTGLLDVVTVLAVNLVTIALTWGFTLAGFDNPRALRARWDLILLRETMSSSLVIHLAMVLWFLHLRLDTYMIQTMAGTVALGYYSVAVMLAETMKVASDSLVVSMRPHQMRGSLRDAAALSLRGARMTVLIGTILGIGWIFAGFWVIQLFYGGEFAPAYIPLMYLVPGMIALGVQRCALGPVLRAGRPWRYAAIYAVSLICNILLNLFLIPLLGISGAAVSSSVSYIMEALLFLAWAARLADVGILHGLVPTGQDLRHLRLVAYRTVDWLNQLSGRA